MDFFETNTQVFIVRVWIEPRTDVTIAPEWRGVIEHVATHQRRYFKDLAPITDFVEQYLGQMRIRVSLRWRVHWWVKKIWHSLLSRRN